MTRFDLLTRSSPLAMAQARMWKDRIESLGHSVRLLDVSTHGDRDRHRHLACFGGFGAFVKALEDRLLSGQGHGAVHSLKDVPSVQPDGLVIAGVLERGPRGDVLVTREGLSLEELPSGAVIGTSSIRRAAQVRMLRGDLNVECCRGNVHSRLRKLEQGLFHGIVLARAGLERLGIRAPMAELPFITSPGQGAVALEAREGSELHLLGARLTHRSTWLEVLAERSFLKAFGMGCSAPVAASAVMDRDTLTLKVQVLSPNGTSAAEAEVSCVPWGEEDAYALGEAAFREISGSPEVLSAGSAAREVCGP
ncbi:hydroxymethylbilane synthase [Thermanaerovibrio acidaminovorans]|uniref:hydroxymethylbilane synthase n=1 Tax=Thermanaerovibrio acidaminovorans TaxID=81462 RepID=UPI0024939564|nr:hydroxymethylbilane synthase [Thermanaerovibrio acidaminovorans]